MLSRYSEKTSLFPASLPTSGLLSDITNIPQYLLQFYTNFAFRVRRGWRTLVKQMRNSGNGIFRKQQSVIFTVISSDN